MSDAWCRLTITARPDRGAELIASIVAHTGNGVEEVGPDVVRTVVANDADADALLDAIPAPLIAGVDRAAAAPIDWSLHWRDGIATRRFGRLVLTPSWLPVVPVAGETVVVIDPESAFGSGEHGSTRGALSLLERHLCPGMRVLDLGAGSGILAIAARRLGAARAIGIEIDGDSIRVAEDNARRNGIVDGVSFVAGDAADLAPLAGAADLICSNILRTVNTALAPMVHRLLAPDGVAIFAGMEEDEAALFEPVLAEVGLVVADTVRDSGWWSVAARRP